MNQQFITSQDEKTNEIKEMLRNQTWDALKQNKEILSLSFTSDIEISPITMLLAERSLALEQLFTNYQKIPIEKASFILRFFTETDVNDLEPLRAKIKEISPDIDIRPLNPEQLANLQTEDRGLINGLNNAKKIALIKLSEEILLDIRMVKNIPPDKITELLNQLQQISNNISLNLSQLKEPTREQIESVAMFLQNIGRTEFEIENLKDPDSVLYLFDILRKSREALQVVAQAQKDNLVGSLEDINVVAGLLEKTQSKKI